MSTKNILLVLSIFIIILAIEIFNGTKPKHPYADLSIEELVETYGYSIETHEVLTGDDYIVTLHRISRRDNKTQENSTPVLFMHGFSQSARDFVNLGPGKALSFLLVELGYDVWLGNARGTTNSRKHIYLDADKHNEYWDFSLDEIGYYDVPAFIDHILEVTKENAVHYIGYSQGTTIFFMLGSEKPEYMRKIKLMTALAPAIFLENPKGPLLYVLKHFKTPLKIFFNLFNIQSVLTEDGLISWYLKHVCNENSLLVELCLQSTFLLHGYNHQQVNKSELSLIFSNTPAGASHKQMLQITQFMKEGEFQRYDLGVKNNLKKYKSEEPPHYNISKIQAPVALYYAANDFTVNEKNIERIARFLPNIVKIHKVSLEDFNHNDFINAKDVFNLLYNEVIEEILKY